jgi:hypothetical protein
MLFGGWQPTVIVTFWSAPPELCAAGSSSPDPQDAAVSPSPATSNRPSALRWLVVLIDLPFSNGRGRVPPLDVVRTVGKLTGSAQYFDR